MNVLKVVGAAALVSFLVACGGGGGGDTTPPVVTPTGAILASPTSCVVQQDQNTCQVSLTTSSTNAVNPMVKNAVGATISTTANGTFPVSVKVGGDTFTFAFGGTASKSVTASAACVGGTTVDATGNCKAPVGANWWPPKNVTPIGTKVFNPIKLTPVSTGMNIGDANWQQDVLADKVKFIDTDLILTGLSSNPIIFAFYVSPTAGNWCTRPVFKSDGSSVGPAGADGNCNTEPIDWAMGTTKGIVRYYPKQNICYELSWDPAKQIATETATTCP